MDTTKGGEIRFPDIMTQHDRQEPEAHRDKGKADREHGKGNTSNIVSFILLCCESP